MGEAETIWGFIAKTLRESEDAPESEYRNGFQDALGLVRTFIEDEYEVLEAL